MIEEAQAFEIAVQEISTLGMDVEVYKEPIFSNYLGWAFGYQSTEYIRTNDFRYALVGNAPIFVLKEEGKILRLGTARSVEHYIDNYIKYGDPHAEQPDPFRHLKPETELVLELAESRQVTKSKLLELLRRNYTLSHSEAIKAYDRLSSRKSAIIKVANPNAVHGLVEELNEMGVTARPSNNP